MPGVLGHALGMGDAAQQIAHPRHAIERLELEQEIDQRGVRTHRRPERSILMWANALAHSARAQK